LSASNDQQRHGVKDRGIGAAGQPDEHHQDELLDRRPTKEQHGYHHEHRVQLRRQGAVQRLRQAVVHDVLKRHAAHLGRVLADAVIDDDGVLHGKADDREQGREEEGIGLPAQHQAGQGEQAHRNQDVVDHRDDGTEAVAEGVRHLAKGKGDEPEDHQRGGDHRIDSVACDDLADGGAHRVETTLRHRPQSRGQRLEHVILGGRVHDLGAHDGDGVPTRKLDRRYLQPLVREDAAYLPRLHRLGELHLDVRAAGKVDTQAHGSPEAREGDAHRDKARDNEQGGEEEVEISSANQVKHEVTPIYERS
jgi:hypothetical protein